jgi:signal transduction histidine kinase
MKDLEHLSKKELIQIIKDLENRVSHPKEAPSYFEKHQKNILTFPEQIRELENKHRAQQDEIAVQNEELQSQLDQVRCAKEKNAETETLLKSHVELAKAQKIAHLGSWEWDAKNDTITFSAETYRIFGLNPKDFNGTFDSFLELIHYSDRYIVRTALLDSLDKALPLELDCRIVSYQGERFVHIKGDSVAVFNKLGKPSRMIGVILDITERKIAENALHEEKMRSDIYLDLMGHDINNMNQIAMGYLELAHDKLKSDGRLDESESEFIERPLETLKSSSKLIDNVRKLRALQENKVTDELISIGEVLDDVKNEYSTMPGRNVTINLTGANGCSIKANKLLRDVFSNIVGNAIKHSNGPLIINILVSEIEQADANYCRVSIDDNGPGIPDTKKKSIFDRFNKGQTHAKGSGLGLHLVKTLVEDFNGRIWVEDRVPGDYTKGSRFVLMLPKSRITNN